MPARMLRVGAQDEELRLRPPDLIAGRVGGTVTAHMAKQEGVRRIVMTGKLIVLIGITLGVLAVVTTAVLREMFLYPGVLYGVSIALRVAACGGLVWAAGWIADGFTTPDS